MKEVASQRATCRTSLNAFAVEIHPDPERLAASAWVSQSPIQSLKPTKEPFELTAPWEKVRKSGSASPWRAHAWTWRRRTSKYRSRLPRPHIEQRTLRGDQRGLSGRLQQGAHLPDVLDLPDIHDG